MPDAPPPPSPAPPLPPALREQRRVLRRRRKRAERKAGRLAEDLAACRRAPALREEAELLKAHLATVPRGQAEVRVPDYFAATPGSERTISLDPARPPRETMLKRFKQAAKLERGRDAIAAEIERNAEACRALAALEDAFDAWAAQRTDAEAPLPADLAQKLQALGIAPQTSAPARRQPGKRELARQALLRGVRTFTSRDGHRIWVGKSAADNDGLTFRLARGRDWWFHLAPAAGSHVVVSLPTEYPALPQETLLDAAHLAVYFSKMRGADRTDVTYTQVKHVRRLRGAPPGKVRVERSESIYLRLEPDRLTRLLKDPPPP